MTVALKRILIVSLIGAFLAGALDIAYKLNQASNQTYVAFQSSDGKWASQEDMKGANFERIVFSFELYKVHCKAKGAYLQRTTINPDPSSKSNTESKWKVAHAERNPNLKNVSYISPNCNKVGYSEREIQIASENTEIFLRNLK